MSSVLRVGLLLTLGLVVLARGLVFLNDRLASFESPTAATLQGPVAIKEPPGAHTPAASAAPATPAPLPPPTESQLLALRAGDPSARWDALVALRKHAVTPELLEALDDVAHKSADFPEVVRFVDCHRARADGASLDIALNALPADLEDVTWYHDAPTCLIELIAARAAENPARAAAVLSERAMDGTAPFAIEALARLDLAELPEPLASVADDATRGRRMRRIHAIETAIAMDAARKWPDRVRRWVDDPLVGSTAVFALNRQSDEASLAVVAHEIAQRPDAGPLASIANLATRKPGTLDLHLAAVAADPQEPAFARGNAAILVAGQGGAEACRRLTRLDAADPAMQADLAAAFRTIDQRFGAGFRAEARR
jgi:hypothetical protein